NGGLAAAADGTTSQTFSATARNPSDNTLGYYGRNFGAAKILSGFKAWGSSDMGFIQNQDPTVTVNFYGGNTQPPSVADATSLGTLRGTASGTDANGLLLQNLLIVNVVGYICGWVTISTGTQANNLAEAQFYEDTYA